jgi:hypothetical protein
MDDFLIQVRLSQKKKKKKNKKTKKQTKKKNPRVGFFPILKFQVMNAISPVQNS